MKEACFTKYLREDEREAGEVIEKWSPSGKRWIELRLTMLSMLSRLIECRKQVEELQRWIPVSERKPRIGEWVNVVYAGVVQRMAARLFGVGFNCVDGYQWAWADDEADPAPLDAITHWREMPKPPAELPSRYRVCL